MKMNLLPTLIALAIIPSLGNAHKLPPAETPQISTSPAVEICFVLDTTGSMGGLIAGAKRKIWSIANEAVSYKPKEVRFGLIGYRDRGDHYITQKTELTDDLDAVHTALNAYQAGGGGDGPESVNQALKEAVKDIKWSTDPQVNKLIFLVGDAPPHMDYEQEMQYPEACKLASQKGIRINTILCGSDQTTAAIWKKIADQGKGQYANIPQTGGVANIATPYDAQLNTLSVTLNGTVSCWGTHTQRKAFNGKLDAINSAPVETQATRAGYASQNYKGGQVVSGVGDLVNDWANGSVKLKDIKPEQLEGDLKGLSEKALEAKLTEKKTHRDTIQKEVAELTKKRDNFIKSECEKQGEKTKQDSFDTQVSEMLKKQLIPMTE